MSLRNGKCPHCNKTDIRYRKDAMYFYRGGSGLSITPMVTFICIECGFVENYVRHHNHLDEVAEKWERLQQQDDSEASEHVS